ncbi:MAG: ketoacyl-ACP synthase III [Candidatus Omnitrophica bacterium]|nr:ketoacyl-ACP synthase III [Candidatus Omnitrophota bacterium]
MKRVGILGLGEYLPQRILGNAELEKMVDTTDEWITSRTGIKERHLVSKLEAASDLAIKAAQEALKDAKIKAEDLELIIVATITPDMQFPATACFLQAGLNAKKAVCFDISAACSGFIYGLDIARQFIAQGSYKNALVVGTEVMSSVTDWQDRGTCVLFGDGAGAAVLGEVKLGGILSTYLGSDGTKADLIKCPGGGSRFPASSDTIKERLHYLKMEGNEVFKLAVNIMANAASEAVKAAGLTLADIDLVVPHQANMRIIMALGKKLNLPEKKIYLNIERCGNMSSASVATALCEAVKEGRVKKNDIILLDSFGAGLVWGAAIIKW